MEVKTYEEEKNPIEKIGSGVTTDIYEKQIILNYLRNLKEEEVELPARLIEVLKKASKEDLTDNEVEFIARLSIIKNFELYELTTLPINYFLQNKSGSYFYNITDKNGRRIDAVMMMVGNKEYRMTGQVYEHYYKKLKKIKKNELLKEEKDYLNYNYISSFRKQKLKNTIIDINFLKEDDELDLDNIHIIIEPK